MAQNVNANNFNSNYKKGQKQLDLGSFWGFCTKNHQQY